MLVSAYSDTNWAGCLDDRKSKGGLLFFLALTRCLGQLESKLLYQDLAQRQNIKP